MAKKKVDQLRSAEEKYQTLIAKRNEFNELSKSIREERNAFNDKKKEKIEKLKETRASRREISKSIGELKDKRDEFQKKAKSMIETKRKLSSSLKRDANLDLDSKRMEAERLEMQQQTVPLTLEKEAELIKKLRGLFDQINELEGLVENQTDMKISLDEFNQAIDEAFRVANSFHHQMMELVQDRKLLDENIAEMVNEIGVLAASGNKKHDDYLTLRKSADHFHSRAQEFREKILEIKAAKRRERQEQRKALQDQNEIVKQELLDDKKLEKAADGALEALLSKKKIEL